MVHNDKICVKHTVLINARYPRAPGIATACSLTPKLTKKEILGTVQYLLKVWG